MPYAQPPPYGAPAGYRPPGQPAHFGPPGQPGFFGPQGPWSGYGGLPFVPPTVKRTHPGRLLAILTVGLLVIGLVVAVASKLATPSHKPVACQPVCDQPPVSSPVSDRPLYVGTDKSYSVRYDPSRGSIRSTTGPNGVTEVWSQLDGGVIKLFGVSASGRSAEQVAQDLIQQSFSDAQRGYAIRNAIVGYQPGYGEIDNVYLQSGGGAATHDRLIVMVAIKHNVALVGEALGPFDAAKPGGSNDDGHPTGASLQIGQLLDPLINSFSWAGDPPR